MSGIVKGYTQELDKYTHDFDLSGHDLSDIPGVRVLNGVGRDEYESLLEEAGFDYEIEEYMEPSTVSTEDYLVGATGWKHLYRVLGDDVVVNSHFSTVDRSDLSIRFRDSVPEDLTDRDKALIQIHQEISAEPYMDRFIRNVKDYFSGFFRN